MQRGTKLGIGLLPDLSRALRSGSAQLIVCMDDRNVRDVKDLIPGISQDKIHLLGEYDSDLSGNVIEDPYYSADIEAFERVYEICERACKAFLESVDFDYV